MTHFNSYGNSFHHLHFLCSFQIRLSSGENATIMGQFWVEWDLPVDRDVATFWRHSVGQSVVESATKHNVEVRSSFCSKRTCCHNKYGIWPDGYPPYLVEDTHRPIVTAQVPLTCAW